MKEISMKDFLACLKKEVKHSYGLVAIENNNVIRYLLCENNYLDKEINYYYFAEWSYGCVGENRIKIMSHLFQKFAIDMAGKAHLEIKVYAHDDEIIRLFSFMQFGIQCEQCICRIFAEDVIENEVVFRKIQEEELQQKYTKSFL